MKVRPVKTKKLPGNSFWKAKDRRSGDGSFEIPGGCEHTFFLHEEPNRRNWRKNKNKRERGSKLTAPSTRTNDHG